MNKIWKIISSTERMGGGGPPLKEFFLVAINDQENALRTLKHKRPDIERSELTVVGEVNPNYVEWFGVKDDDIFCLRAVYDFCLRRCDAPACTHMATRY